MYVCMYVYVCVCVFVCMYVHTHLCVCVCTHMICPTVSAFLINWAEYQNPFSTYNAYFSLRHWSCENIKSWRLTFKTYIQWTHKCFNWLKEIVLLYSTNSQVLLMELVWADSDLCNIRRMAEGNCPAILSHPSSSEQSQKVETIVLK